MASAGNSSYMSWDELEVPENESCESLLEATLRELLKVAEPTKKSAPKVHSKVLPEWQVLFNALTNLQILCKYAPDLLLPHLHVLFPAVNEACGSLRSGVTKNGLLSVYYLSEGIGRHVSPYVTLLLPTLISKALNDKKFISEPAWDACASVCGPSSATENTLNTIVKLSVQHKVSSHFVCKCAQLFKITIESLMSMNIMDSNGSSRGLSTSQIPNYHLPLSPRKASRSLHLAEPNQQNSRSVSTPHLPFALSQTQKDLHSVNNIFFRGIGTVLATFLTERLPATKQAARDCLRNMVMRYGENYTRQCLLANGTGDVKASAVGRGGLQPVTESFAKDAILKGVADAAKNLLSRTDSHRTSNTTSSRERDITVSKSSLEISASAKTSFIRQKFGANTAKSNITVYHKDGNITKKTQVDPTSYRSNIFESDHEISPRNIPHKNCSPQRTFQQIPVFRRPDHVPQMLPFVKPNRPPVQPRNPVA